MKSSMFPTGATGAPKRAARRAARSIPSGCDDESQEYLARLTLAKYLTLSMYREVFKDCDDIQSIYEILAQVAYEVACDIWIERGQRERPPR